MAGMPSNADMVSLAESLNGSLAEFENWKSEINKNVDQFFLLIMGFIVYCK